jgi:hypothetical protein
MVSEQTRDIEAPVRGVGPLEGGAGSGFETNAEPPTNAYSPGHDEAVALRQDPVPSLAVRRPRPAFVASSALVSPYRSRDDRCRSGPHEALASAGEWSSALELSSPGASLRSGAPDGHALLPAPTGESGTRVTVEAGTRRLLRSTPSDGVELPPVVASRSRPLRRRASDIACGPEGELFANCGLHAHERVGQRRHQEEARTTQADRRAASHSRDGLVRGIAVTPVRGIA